MRTLTGTAVLAAGAAAAVALTGCGNVSFGGTRHEDRSYTAPAGVTALKIKTTGSRVEVTASDSPGIKVEERLRWSNDKNKPQAKHSVEGDTLSLTAKCGTQAIGIASSCGVSYRVRVPRSMPVQIDNRDGAIVASGLAGAVKLHSDNGSITATGLRASTASLSSADGSLRVSGRVTTADLRSDNGAVAATGLAADRITARTRDGGIDLRLSAPPANIDANTDNGPVQLRLPAEPAYAISASTDNGRKLIDAAIHEDSRAERRIKLTTRDGAISVSPN